ncbi:MAG: transketolase family protein [Candidatus Binatia bacterium]
MRTAFIDTLMELAQADERVWMICGDLGYGVLDKFAAAFPERFINAGVAEQSMMGIAAGLAMSGKTVFVYSIANFPTMRCFEQIRNDVCYHQANVKIVAVGGGFTYGTHGYTHHGVEDLAVMRALPGMTVAAPGDPLETDLVTRALAVRPGPAYLRLGKAGESRVHNGTPEFEFGKALAVRPGKDATIITTGGMLKTAVAVADRLRTEGLSVRILSMPVVKPIDAEAILVAARETGVIVTAEEHSVTGGLGSAVAEVLAEAEGLRARFKRFGVADRLAHDIGSQGYLRRLMGDLGEVVLQAAAR